MEQTTTETATTETAATAAAPEATTATTTEAQPIETIDATSAASGPDDAYTLALKKHFGKPEGENPADQKADEHKKAEGEGNAEKKDGATRDEKADEWWKAKKPGEKAAILAKQDREALKKARAEIEELKANLEELKPKKADPGAEQFASTEEYIRHLVDNRLIEADEERAAKAQKEREAQERQSAAAAKWRAAMERDFTNPEEREAAAELFRTKVNLLTLSPSVYDYILESGQPRLLLHIVRNPGAQELLKPGTPELLVGKRLTAIENYLAQQKKVSGLADTGKKPAATTAATREPALKSATGSANNIGSTGVKANNVREAEARDLQAQILGLRV